MRRSTEIGKTDVIIFYDSTINIDNLKEITANRSHLIITLDYGSHMMLERNNLIHISSDNFLTKNDLTLIQEKSYYFARWSVDEDIKDSLIYNGINIGKLPYIEFHYELVQFLKKVVSIKRIMDTHLKKDVYCSNEVRKILDLFLENVKILESESVDQKIFLYDRIRAPLNFFGLSTSFYISKKKYVFLRNLVERISSYYINRKNKKFRNTNKQNLLVECDTIRITDLLKADKNSCFTIYNRRRPSIWNFKSFITLKNSKVHILNGEELIKNNPDIKNDCQSVINEFTQIIKENEFFEKFFVIDKVNFWKAIKDDFVKLHIARINEAVLEINLAKIIFRDFAITSVTVWSESGFNEQILIGLAKSYGIPINLVQHGIYYDTDEAATYNEFNGIFPVTSDNFLSWGEITSNYFKNLHLNKNIIDVGSIFYDSIIQHNKSGDYILLTTTSPGRNIASELTDESIRKYEDNIKEICNICKKLNKKLVIKMHPFQDEREILSIVKTIDKNIRILQYANTLDLISSCFCLLSIDLSTTILEAHLMGKPVITVRTKEPGLGLPSIFKSNAIPYITIEELEEQLQKILTNDAHRKQIIENGRNYVSRFFTNLGTASDSFLRFFITNINN